MINEDITKAIAATAPFDFRLSNQQGQTVLYTRLQQQDMRLELLNTSQGNLTIKASQSKDDWHFQLRFRSGTLWEHDKVKLFDQDNTNWEMSSLQPPLPLSTGVTASASKTPHDAVFYLRYKGTEKGEDKDLTFKPGERKSLSLRGIKVDGRSGSRGTRVELKYQQLKSAGNPESLSGTCMHYLSVLDESPANEPGTAPILIDWAGPNTFLNDGTETTRILRLYNQTGQELKLDEGTKITIDLPVGDDKAGWALILKADKTSVKVENLTGWKKTDDPKQSDDKQWMHIEFAPNPQPPLAPNQQIDIPITLTTTCRSGPAFIKVHYEGFAHLQGTRYVGVEKTPLVISPTFAGESSITPGQLHVGRQALVVDKVGQVGIGTGDPGQNRLQVAGGPVQLDGDLTVGGASTFTGNVVIETPEPLKALTVMGTIALNDNTRAFWKLSANVGKTEGRRKDANAAFFYDTDSAKYWSGVLVGDTGKAGFVQAASQEKSGVWSDRPLSLQHEGGNVGIGTGDPGQNRLQVAGGPVQLDGDLTVGGASTFEDNVTLSPGKSLTVKASGGYGSMTFSVPTWYQPTIRSETNLIYNAGGGGRHHFKINDDHAMTIDEDGNVGIGTDNPTQAKLVVIGSAPFALSDFDSLTYLNGVIRGGNNNKITNPYSLHVDKRIGALRIDLFSDERMKNIQGRSDPAMDLQSLLGIEVTDYRYKDVIGKGNAPHKKLIAQQVEEVFPQAVSKHTDVVPDIYQQASIKDGWVALATDLEKGERVKLISEKGEGIHKVLDVTKDKFRTDFKPEGEKVFVFGREVQDFRTVDYDAIAMLNVSATQELARKLEAKESEIAELQKQLAEQGARLFRLEGLEARLDKTAFATDAPVRTEERI